MMTGANLALLTRCPFGTIKLDRNIVAQIQQDEPTPEWLAGLEALLRSSSLQVIAEGVESDYQARMLRAAGVQMAQGHLFSRPLTARVFKDLFAGHHPQDGSDA